MPIAEYLPAETSVETSTSSRDAKLKRSAATAAAGSLQAALPIALLIVFATAADTSRIIFVKLKAGGL